MKTCNHTTEQCNCLSFHDNQLTISQIQQINLGNSSAFKQLSHFLEHIRHLYNAEAVFIHALQARYAMFHACSGMQATHSLRFAGHSARVLAKQAMLVSKLELEGWYSGIPVLDHEGRAVLILSMIHKHAITELPAYQDFIPATLAYLQHMLYAHASA